MRFGVFRLSYKTQKEAGAGDTIKYTYKLVYKDGLGNQLVVSGTEDDYEAAELGEVLPWNRLLRQETLEAT